MRKTFYLTIISSLVFLGYLLSPTDSLAACCATSDPSCSGAFVCSNGGVTCSSASDCPASTPCYNPGQTCTLGSSCCGAGYSCSSATLTCVNTTPPPAPSSSNRPVECNLANISPSQTGQNWDVTYCLRASSVAELNRITRVTAICREAPDPDCGGDIACSAVDIVGDLTAKQNCSCYYDSNMSPFVRPDLYGICNMADLNPFTPPAPAARSNQSLPEPVKHFDDVSGLYYSCYTLTQLNRNMGTIEVIFKDSSGQPICRPDLTQVTPGNYSWWEYYDNTLEDRFGIDLPLHDPTEKSKYTLTCSTVTGKEGINTAFGCFAAEPIEFTQDFLTVSIGIAGGLGLLLILYGTGLIVLSKGNPQKVQAGKQIITAVIEGLLLITLAVAMLNFVGINILNLPGLQ